MYLYAVCNTIYTFYKLTPYSFIKTGSFCFTADSLTLKQHNILSIIYTTPNPSFSLSKYSAAATYFSASTPIFCIYSFLISNIFYNLAYRFSLNLPSTRNLYNYVVLLIIKYKTWRQFSSISFCSSTSAPFNPCLCTMGKRYLRAPN